MKLPLNPAKHPDLAPIDRNSSEHERELHSFFEVTVSQVKSLSVDEFNLNLRAQESTAT